MCVCGIRSICTENFWPAAKWRRRGVKQNDQTKCFHFVAATPRKHSTESSKRDGEMARWRVRGVNNAKMIMFCWLNFKMFILNLAVCANVVLCLCLRVSSAHILFTRPAPKPMVHAAYTTYNNSRIYLT